jgi:hypothetical protein
LVETHKEKKELMVDIYRLKDQNNYLNLKIDKLKDEKEAVKVENEVMIQHFSNQVVEIAKEKDNHDKDIVQVAFLKSKIFELSNKLFSLEKILKLEEKKVAKLSYSLQGKEVIVKSLKIICL